MSSSMQDAIILMLSVNAGVAALLYVGIRVHSAAVADRLHAYIFSKSYDLEKQIDAQSGRLESLLTQQGSAQRQQAAETNVLLTELNATATANFDALNDALTKNKNTMIASFIHTQNMMKDSTAEVSQQLATLSEKEKIAYQRLQENIGNLFVAENHLEEKIAQEFKLSLNRHEVIKHLLLDTSDLTIAKIEAVQTSPGVTGELINGLDEKLSQELKQMLTRHEVIKHLLLDKSDLTIAKIEEVQASPGVTGELINDLDEKLSQELKHMLTRHEVIKHLLLDKSDLTIAKIEEVQEGHEIIKQMVGERTALAISKVEEARKSWTETNQSFIDRLEGIGELNGEFEELAGRLRTQAEQFNDGARHQQLKLLEVTAQFDERVRLLESMTEIIHKDSYLMMELLKAGLMSDLLKDIRKQAKN